MIMEIRAKSDITDEEHSISEVTEEGADPVTALPSTHIGRSIY